MEKKQDTYQGGQKKAMWTVSILAKGKALSTINVLADSAAQAKRDSRVVDAIKLLKKTNSKLSVKAVVLTPIA